ncbi:hypothetical protein KIPE111705_46305 [Kibdelosporangium persicum]
MCDSSRAACSLSAAGFFAESNQGSGPVAALRSAGAATGGACSMITCAFVPLMPNDDTPARRAPLPGCHGAGSVSSRMSPVDQSTWGVGWSTCNVFGSTPCRIAWTTLITPSTPAAAWVWPMFDFTDPSHNGRSRSRP